MGEVHDGSIIVLSARNVYGNGLMIERLRA